MQAWIQGWRTHLPEGAAILLGAAIGLLAALALAAPFTGLWSSHLVPAFGSLLSTLYVC